MRRGSTVHALLSDAGQPLNLRAASFLGAASPSPWCAAPLPRASVVLHSRTAGAPASPCLPEAASSSLPPKLPPTAAAVGSLATQPRLVCLPPAGRGHRRGALPKLLVHRLKPGVAPVAAATLLESHLSIAVGVPPAAANSPQACPAIPPVHQPSPASRGRDGAVPVRQVMPLNQSEHGLQPLLCAAREVPATVQPPLHPATGTAA